MSRTSRLFDLMGILRARRLPVTAFDLARELDVSQRSVYRDVETLRSLGAPLEGQAGVGYCLREGFFLPELAFSPDELEALILGLGWVQQRADPALARCSESALAKVLSAKRDGPAAGGEPPALMTAASISERVDPPQAALLRDAIRRQRKVAIGYEDVQGCLSERTVWPIVIVYFDDVRILAAWCERRSAFRHFRVDRLEVRAVLEERYPGRRHTIVRQWRQRDRDWRSLQSDSVGVDHPLGPTQGREVGPKGGGVGERGQIAEEGELARSVRLGEAVEEQAAEQAREHPHWKEEPRSGGNSAGCVERQPAARDDAVQVGMVGQRRSPGVQDGGHADAGAQMPGIGGDGQQGLGGRLEQ